MFELGVVFAGYGGPHTHVLQAQVWQSTTLNLRQFIYNQGVVRARGNTSFSNALAGENRLVGHGMALILSNLERITYLALGGEGVMSPGGNLLWANYLRAMDGFILGKDEFVPESITPMPMKGEGPFLSIKKKIGPVLNMEVGRYVASALVIIEADAL